MNAAYTWAIDDALRKASVEVPYPQRELRVRSLFGHEGKDALRALNLETAEEPPAPAPAASTNDAAEDLMQPEQPLETSLDEDEAAEKQRAG